MPTWSIKYLNILFTRYNIPHIYIDGWFSQICHLTDSGLLIQILIMICWNVNMIKLIVGSQTNLQLLPLQLLQSNPSYSCTVSIFNGPINYPILTQTENYLATTESYPQWITFCHCCCWLCESYSLQGQLTPTRSSCLIRSVFKIILPNFVVSDLSLVEGKGNEVSMFEPF